MFAPPDSDLVLYLPSVVTRTMPVCAHLANNNAVCTYLYNSNEWSVENNRREKSLLITDRVDQFFTSPLLAFCKISGAL